MNDEAYKVTVAKDLEDLIPAFMRNRNKELETLKVALAAADFEQLRQLGHRMKGVGNSYGFAHVSVLGQGTEDGARRGDRASLESHIAQYGDYVAKVQIAFELAMRILIIDADVDLRNLIERYISQQWTASQVHQSD